MRHRSRWWFPAACAAAFGALAMAARAANAQGSHVGARIGYDFDAREVLLSTNLSVPVSNRVEFYPSLDIYTPDRGSRLGFNGDFKVRFPVRDGPEIYAGGGLGVINRNVDDFHRTDVGANLIMGMQSRAGNVHPFVEGRVQLHDRSTFRLIGGLNFTIGR